MQLIENENILNKSANEEMTLTDLRVVKSVKLRGLTNYSSIFLNKISSVHFRSQEFKWLLYIGVAFAVFGLFSLLLEAEKRAGGVFAGLLMSGIFVGAYFLTRRQILEICGTGSERIFTVMSKDFDTAFKFLAAIESASKTGARSTETERIGA
jgi:hypothetical protein